MKVGDSYEYYWARVNRSAETLHVLMDFVREEGQEANRDAVSGPPFSTSARTPVTGTEDGGSFGILTADADMAFWRARIWVMRAGEDGDVTRQRPQDTTL